MRVFSSERGASLVTLIVASVIGLIVAIAGFGVLQHLQTNLVILTKKTQENEDIAVFKGMYEKAITRSDFHIFGYTDSQLQPLYRAMLPLPGRCADLSACADQVAIAFGYYNERTVPFVSATCAFPTTPPTLIIDTQADPLHTVSAGGAGFNVNSAGQYAVKGPVTLTANSLIAMGDTPQLTLWTVRTPPVPIPITYNAATRLFNNPTFQSIPDCYSSLNLNVTANYANRFYQVQVAPFQFAPIFSGANLPAAVNGMAQFPIRVMNAEFMTVGYLPAAGNRPARVALVGCQVVGGNQLNCNQERYAINNVLKMRVGVAFDPELIRGTPSPEVYDVVGGQAACEGVTETCEALNVNAGSPTPVLAGESYDRLLPGQFSLIKLEKLSRIKLRVQLDKQKRFQNQTADQTVQWETIDNVVP